MTNLNSNACNPRGFDLPYMQRPICPSASARRKLTRNCLEKQKNIAGRLTRPATTVDDNLRICGRKLHVESEASRAFYGRPTASVNELGVLPCPCAHHYDSAGKLDINSATHLSVPSANDHHGCCCADESFADRCEEEFANDDHILCQLSKQCRHCRACQQRAELLNAQDETNERFDTSGAEAEILHSSEETYSNVRIDHNRMLKVLRKFDTIRRRAREAKEECLLRFETRQKQRLRVLNLSDLERQQKRNDQEVIGNDMTVTWNDRPMGVDVGLQSRGVDVKVRDVIDLCDPTRSAKSQTTWPPALDDSPVNFEPTNAVISRLMSQFEQIRLNSATARLTNQKRFNAKRRQRKHHK